MGSAAEIKHAHERYIDTLKRRPSTGRGTSFMTTRSTGGLACEFSSGDWKFTADLSQAQGGDDKGPSPGTYVLGALTSCLVMGISVMAARRGIEIKGLAIETEADWDAQGMYGLGDNIPPGYTAIRLAVDIDSPAPPEEVDRLLADAAAISPNLDVFRRANDVTISRKAKVPA